MMKRAILIVMTAILLSTASVGTAAEPGFMWSPILFGAQRERIHSLPIVDRPYRPLHFYGNAVRRRYYHGSALPRPRGAVRR